MINKGHREISRQSLTKKAIHRVVQSGELVLTRSSDKQRQILWEVELPLASRTILAGVRVATVTTIGTATIAAAIGGGGLGVFIFRGLASVDSAQILAGAIPAACIALAAEGGLGWVERKLSPV